MPRYNLDQVKELAADENKVNIHVNNALDRYMRTVGLPAKARKKAKDDIRKGLQKLKPEHFSETKLLPTTETGRPEHYDVYGLPNYKGFDWYVKFRIDRRSGVLINVSFHLPDDDIKTPNGRIICSKGN